MLSELSIIRRQVLADRPGTDWDYLIKIFRIALGIARGQFLALHWYLIVLITILEI